MFKELSMRTLLNTVVLYNYSGIFSSPLPLKIVTRQILTYYGMKLRLRSVSAGIIPFFAGVVCGNILDVVKRFKLKKEIKRLRNELEKLDQV